MKPYVTNIQYGHDKIKIMGITVSRYVVMKLVLLLGTVTRWLFVHIGENWSIVPKTDYNIFL